MFTKSFQIKALDDAGSGTAVIATLGVIDLDGDVTEAGAFGSGQVAKFLPAHDWMHVPLGTAAIKEVGDEVRAEFQLNLDIPAAKDWHSALKFNLSKGVRQEFSYGFKIKEQSFGEHEGQQVRFLKQLEVLEISPVVQGAGIGTELRSVKDHKSLPFADQIKATKEAVEAVTARALDIRQKRLADGRDISPDRLKELEGLSESVESLSIAMSDLGKVTKMSSVVPVRDEGDDEEMDRITSNIMVAKLRADGHLSN